MVSLSRTVSATPSSEGLLTLFPCFSRSSMSQSSMKLSSVRPTPGLQFFSNSDHFRVGVLVVYGWLWVLLVWVFVWLFCWGFMLPVVCFVCGFICLVGFCCCFPFLVCLISIFCGLCISPSPCFFTVPTEPTPATLIRSTEYSSVCPPGHDSK